MAIVDPRNLYRVCYCRLPLLQMLHQSLTKPLQISLRRLVYKQGQLHADLVQVFIRNTVLGECLQDG